MVSHDKPSGGATEVRAVFTRAGGYLLLQRSPPTQGIGLWGIYFFWGGGGGSLPCPSPYRRYHGIINRLWAKGTGGPGRKLPTRF